MWPFYAHFWHVSFLWVLPYDLLIRAVSFSFFDPAPVSSHIKSLTRCTWNKFAYSRYLFQVIILLLFYWLKVVWLYHKALLIIGFCLFRASCRTTLSKPNRYTRNSSSWKLQHCTDFYISLVDYLISRSWKLDL